MRRFVIVSLAIGIPFGFFMGLGWVFLSGSLARGLLGGAAAGLLFGLLFAAAVTTFVAYQRSQFGGQCPLGEGEILVKEGPASHFMGAEGVGGWLYLTNQHLVFRSHRWNIQAHQLSISLGDILEARPSRTLGLIPNGLRVRTPDRDERFVVEDHASWADEINRLQHSPD